MNRQVFFFVSLFTCFLTGAQTGVPAFIKSTLVLISENREGKEIKFSVESAYMTLNTSSGDFTLNADLADLVTGDKKQDSLISSNGSQSLVFSGNISENLILFNEQQNDEKNYPMPGVLSLNNNSVSCVAQFDPINLAEKSETKNYRMDFTLSVDASRFAIKGLENLLFKQVAFEIVAGKLNIIQ